VIRQLLQLFRGKVDDNGKLQVNIVSSRPTPQPSSYDCGVYAAAYATELALNNAPSLQAPFYTQQMCDHLARCMESGELEQFPRDDTRQLGRQCKVTRLSDGDSGVEVLQ